MKIWHTGGATEIAHEKGTFTKQDDGSFEVPEQVFEAVKFAGFVTENPNPEQKAADDDGGFMAQLAKKTKAEILAYAKEAYGADLAPGTKDELLEQVVKLAAKSADDAARLAELEAIPAAGLTEEQAAELAALKGEE